MGIAQENFQIYRGDDWSHLYVIMSEGGLYVTDAQFTSGVDQLIIPSGGLTEDHKTLAVACVTGVGVSDGTTITDVASDGRSATLSGVATSTRKKVRMVIGGMDLSGFSLAAQVRANPDAPTTLYDLGIDETRKAAGIIRFYLGHDLTKNLGPTGVWDLQLTDGDGVVSTIAGGSISVTHDVTKVA